MDLSIPEVAELCGGTIRGSHRGGRITGFGTLAEASAGDLSFLGNLKYLPDFERTKASVVLVVPETPEVAAVDAVLIEVDNPSLAFSQVLTSLQPKRYFEAGIHPTAVVAPSAKVEGAMIRENAVICDGVTIGAGTEVGPCCLIERDSQVGTDCLLHGNISIRERCRLGDRITLQPGVVIGSEGFGYELVDGCHRPIPQLGIVVIGDDVEIGSNSTIDRARFGETVIGEGTKIDNLVQIGHNVQVGKHCLIIAQTGIAGSVTLGDYVTVAAQSGLAGHLEIVSRTVIAAQTGVTKSLTKPDVYWGAPARPLREVKRQLVMNKRIPAIYEDLRELKRRVAELEEGE